MGAGARACVWMQVDMWLCMHADGHVVAWVGCWDFEQKNGLFEQKNCCFAILLICAGNFFLI